MSQVNLNIDPKLLPHIIRFVKEVALKLRDNLAISPNIQSEDPEFSSIYLFDLQEVLQKDCEHLLFVLEDTRLGNQSIPIEHELADPTLRAASAVRMRIRNEHLSAISDNDLESGNLSFDTLNHNLQLAYACYLFLAALQESLIHSIDPSLQEI